MSMRLRLEASGEVPFWFVGDPTKNERTEMSLALDESFQYQRNQQSVSGVEWEAQKHYDRKNQRFSVAATVNYKFESDWERMDFFAKVAALDPADRLHKWEGQVWLRIDKAGTTEFREWQLADAIIGINATVPKGGISLDLRYTVTCKGFSSAQEGTSEIVQLVGELVQGLSLSAAAAEMQELIDEVIFEDTTHFEVVMRCSFPVGPDVVTSRYFLPPGGTPVPGVSYALPVADSLAALAADLAATFTALEYSALGDVLHIADTTPVTTTSFYLALFHTYDTYGTTSDPLQQWDSVEAPVGEQLLTGTLNGVDYKLVGTLQNITS